MAAKREPESNTLGDGSTGPSEVASLVDGIGSGLDEVFHFVLGYDGETAVAHVPGRDGMPGGERAEERAERLSSHFQHRDALLVGPFRAARQRSGVATSWFRGLKVVRRVAGDVEVFVGLPFDTPLTPVLGRVDSELGRMLDRPRHSPAIRVNLRSGEGAESRGPTRRSRSPDGQ